MILYNGFEFLYCVNPESNKPIMEINTHIGDTEDGPGIDGNQFSRELTILDGLKKEEIQIYINSHGGRVDDGWTIFTSILRCKTKTCGYVAGLAASIAGIIFQACDERKMYEHSILMVHNPAVQGEENANINEDPLLKIIKESLKIMLKSHNKLSDENLDKIMNEETWMLADEAKEMGFADEVLEYSEKVGTMDIKYIINNKKEIKSLTNRFSSIMNQIIIENKTNKYNMKEKLLKLLELTNTASEKDILNAAKVSLPFLFNAAPGEDRKEAGKGFYNEDDKDEIVDDCDPMTMKNDDDTVIKGADKKVLPTHLIEDYEDNEEIMDYKKAYMDLKSEMAKMNNSRILDLIDSAEETGKIISSHKAYWITLAKKDYKSTEAILNSMPISKKNISISGVIDNAKTKEVLEDKKSKIENQSKTIIENISKNIDFDLTSAFDRINKIK